MNLGHLADALDSWKGWLIGSLRPLLRTLYVVPMLTDPNKWNARHFRLYAQVLRVPTSRIILRADLFTHDTRDNYFTHARLEKLPQHLDLFLDPDTGIWGAPQRRPPDVRHRYVRTSELAHLLPNSSKRVIIVYRHGRETMDTLSQHVTSYATSVGNCFALAIRGGGVTAALFSRFRKRLNSFRRLLVSKFRPVQDERVSELLVGDGP
jgi:hypothetical protein